MDKVDDSKSFVIHSKKLGSDVIVAPDIETARQLYKAGHREQIYLHSEVEIMRDHKISDRALELVNIWKDIMPGSMVAEMCPAPEVVEEECERRYERKR